jgi:hypothetical protein
MSLVTRLIKWRPRTVWPGYNSFANLGTSPAAGRRETLYLGVLSGPEREAYYSPLPTTSRPRKVELYHRPQVSLRDLVLN